MKYEPLIEADHWEGKRSRGQPRVSERKGLETRERVPQAGTEAGLDITLSDSHPRQRSTARALATLRLFTR